MAKSSSKKSENKAARGPSTIVLSPRLWDNRQQLRRDAPRERNQDAPVFRLRLIRDCSRESKGPRISSLKY